MGSLGYIVLLTMIARLTGRSFVCAAFAPGKAFPSRSPNAFSLHTRLFSSSDSGIFAEGASFDSLLKSDVLRERLYRVLGADAKPTQIQAASAQAVTEGETVILGAETGSGKTLAYLLPLLDDILQQKSEGKTNYDYARAIVLVPNKELVQQVLRMATPLCGGVKSIVWGAGSFELEDDVEEEADPEHLVRLAVLPGGLNAPVDFKPFRDSLPLGGINPPVDLVVTTPAALGPLGLKPKNIDLFADIPTLVIDEADMLLDGGYRRPLEDTLIGFRRADKLNADLNPNKTQYIFGAATLPNMGLKSVDAYLQRRFPHAQRIHMTGMHNAKHYGLAQSTQWKCVDTKKERMEQLIELLETPKESGGLKGEKIMIFLNSVDDVEGAQGALEGRGVDSVPYHAKITLDERSKNLDRFRRYDPSDPEENTCPVLVCTDLAARGLDVPGVTAVVQLQFAGNVVAHLHRMGRCGRAGQRTGRGIVFYDPLETELVKVVQEAEEQQEAMVLQGDVQDLEDATVQKAFSRRRGFSKKRKKLKREASEA